MSDGAAGVVALVEIELVEVELKGVPNERGVLMGLDCTMAGTVLFDGNITVPFAPWVFVPGVIPRHN